MKLADGGYYATPVGVVPNCKDTDMSLLKDAIDKNRRLVGDLDTNKFPVELSEVVMYLKRMQSFWLWQAEQQLAFRQGGDIPEEYDGIELQACDTVADTARSAEDKAESCRVFTHDWQGCVSRTVQPQLGSYPKQQWKAFLDAYGIRERLESTIND
jgi:hypothetical protein